MLRMPQDYTYDDKANAIIAEYLNGNILELVMNEIIEYEDLQGKKAEEDDPAFQEAVSDFFPEGYPQEKMGKVFMGLKALLESEYEFVPELIMEYVMYRLIQTRICISDDTGTDTLDPISTDRDYVIRVLKEEASEEEELAEEEEEEFIVGWEERLCMLEDLHYYEDIYFWDVDYLQLDYYTEQELMDSPVSKVLGIDNIGDRGEKFEVPSEWLK